jgi:hypothetical protein
MSITHIILIHLPPPGFPTAEIQTRAPSHVRQEHYHWPTKDMLKLKQSQAKATDRWTQ